jgi:hypothetical protein
MPQLKTTGAAINSFDNLVAMAILLDYRASGAP